MLQQLLFMVLIVSFVSCVPEADNKKLYSHDLTAKVVRVKDGDSFLAQDDDKNEIEVRLRDIDAPELSQMHGKEAKAFLSHLIQGKKVGIDFEKTDKYDRLLAYIYLDSINVNEAMLRAGYAWHFKRFSRNDKLQQLEDNARKRQKGLWQEKKPIAPWDWRVKH